MFGKKVPKTDYSSVGEYYDKVRPEPADVWISSIISVGGITPDSDVLDIGCGTGRYTTRVAKACRARIRGVDSSIVMLRNAFNCDRQRVIDWVLGDARSLPFKSTSFDCVYMTMVLHHIESREAVLATIHRLLRAGGRCVIATASHAAIKANVLRHFPGLVSVDLKRFPSIPLLKSDMKKAGFKNVRSSVVKHDEGEITVESYLERVRNKYISTLSLLSESEFQAGLKVFEKRLRELYGDRMRRVLAFTFVTGERDG